MRKLSVLVLLFILPSLSSGQSQVDSFFNLKSQVPPNNWTELIQRTKPWILYKIAFLKGRRLNKVIAHGALNATVKYEPSQMRISAKSDVDSLNVIALTYFQEQNTYTTKQEIPSGEGKSLTFYKGEKVINVNQDFLTLEPIELYHYDYRTGEIITFREYRKRFYKKDETQGIFGGKMIVLPFLKSKKRTIFIYRIKQAD